MGGDKAAALIGGTTKDSTGSSIVIKSVNVKNTTVLGYAFVAKAVACIWSNLDLTFENCDFSGVTVDVNEYFFDWNDFKDFVTDESITLSGVGTYIEKIKSTFPDDYEKVTTGNRYVRKKDSPNRYWAITTEDNYWKGKIELANETCRTHLSGNDNITTTSNN